MRTRTQTIILSTLACVAVLQPLGLAFAQTQSRQPASRAAQEAACTGDATQFCGPDIPDEQKIAACLRANRSKISAACRAVLN